MQPLRLMNAFGLVSYSLSPSGARRLLAACFPLRNEAIPIPGLGRHLLNISVDATMSKHYRTLNSFACFPALGVDGKRQVHIRHGADLNHDRSTPVPHDAKLRLAHARNPGRPVAQPGASRRGRRSARGNRSNSTPTARLRIMSWEW